MKKSIILTFFSFIMATYISMGQAHDPTSMDNHKMNSDMSCCEDTTGTAGSGFHQQFNGFVKSAMDLKDEFFKSNASQVSMVAGKVKNDLEKIDMKSLNEKDHMYWMNNLNAMKHNLAAMQESKDIEAQRTEFASFNESFYKSIKTLNCKEIKLYYDFCPMALNQKGAYWLSNTPEIHNPYFGDKMPECGIIKKTIN